MHINDINSMMGFAQLELWGEGVGVGGAVIQTSMVAFWGDGLQEGPHHGL